MGLLRRGDISEVFMQGLWKKATAPGTPRIRVCPHCGRRMAEVRSDIGGKELALDVCTVCQSIWFDPKEHEVVPSKAAMPRKELSPEAKVAIARAEMELQEELEPHYDMGSPPDTPWQQAVTFLGLPAVIDEDKIAVRPYLIWGLALACILVYIIFGRRMETVAFGYGFMPELWYRKGGLTLLTSFFLHANFLHLGANIYFLLVFGDHLEGFLGRWRLVWLILGSHLAGIMAHYMIFPHGITPLIGASGLRRTRRLLEARSRAGRSRG